MDIKLILDQYDAPDYSQVTFHLGEIVKEPMNPVLQPGQPHQWDSLQVCWPATVLYDKQLGKFRCWYSGFDANQKMNRQWFAGYAESLNGVDWVKPNLGQVNYLDADTNQIGIDWDYTVLSSVFENPDKTAQPRWGSLWTERETGVAGKADRWLLRKGLAWSEDGLRWQRDKTAYQGLVNDRPSFLDISQLLFDQYDQGKGLVKGYGQIYRPRSWDGRLVRQIGLATGPNVGTLHEADDAIVLAPEKGIDEELHFAGVQKIGQGYVMLFESDRFSHNPIRGDLRLAFSPDGKKFRRLHPEQPMVKRGNRGMWDENLLVTTTAGMLPVGDTLYIFYLGCGATFNSWPPEYAVDPSRRGSMFSPTAMGLATLKRDRWCYAQGPGYVEIQTEPLTGELCLNTDHIIQGITALDDHGQTIATGRLMLHHADGLYRQVVWKGDKPVGCSRWRIPLNEQQRLYSVAANYNR